MTLRLFQRFDAVAEAVSQPIAADYYQVLARMREAVRAGVDIWALDPEFVAYADVCFWAMRKLEYSFAAQAIESLELPDRPLRILDVGCGVVPWCNWLSMRGHEVTAVDPSAEIIGLLNRYNLNRFYGSSVIYEVANGEDLSYPDASFDLVTCISVLEHIAPGNDRLALRQFGRVLKPGGSLVLTFDVAPDAPLQPGEKPWPPNKRRYAQPFSPRSTERLLSKIRTSFEVEASDVPPELYDLDWDAVHGFWREASVQDVREQEEREYVAMGGVLRRVALPDPISVEEIKAAYAEGVHALQERLEFFQMHAEQRLEVVRRLEEEVQDLQVQHVEAHEPPDESSTSVIVDAPSVCESEDESVSEDSPESRLALKLSQNTDMVARLLNQLSVVNQQIDESAAGNTPNGTRVKAAEQQRELAESVAEARLRVIEQQLQSIEGYRRTQLSIRVRRRLTSLVSPRIGVLEQYPPRKMKIPSWYWSLDNPGSLPSISIVTPTLNQGKFIERSLRSVLGQNYPRLQYVVQDGGSTDRTLSILDRYQMSLARVVSEPDRGFGDALNRGFGNANGEILAYLNSDDVLLPGALHFVAAYFRSHPDVDVVYGHRVVIDQADGEIGRWVMPPHDDDVLSWADYVPQETLFWRRSIWDKSGGNIDETFRFAIDWDLLLRFRDAGATMHRLPRFLGAFRVHPDQKTSSEMIAVGAQEMERLRVRALGRTVSNDEIRRALARYLRRHFVLHKLYRLGLLRY